MFSNLLSNDNTFYITGIILITLTIFLVAFATRKKEIKEVHDMDNEKAKSELERMLEIMKADLEEKKNRKVVSFEEEQEENAIISYNELLKANGKELEEEIALTEQQLLKREMPALNQKQEFEEENPVLIQEIEEDINNDENLDMIDDIDLNEVFQSKINLKDVDFDSKPYGGKFKTTDMISPIYGLIDDVDRYSELYDSNDSNTIKRKEAEILDFVFEEEDEDDSTERDLYLEELNATMEYNSEFLDKLKEFREQLNEL